MSITVESVIDNAFAKSAAARLGIAASPAELVARVQQCLLECFQVLSRENPLIIGKIGQMAFGSGAWPRPTDCLRVLSVVADSGTVATPTIAAGVELTIVPFGDTAIVSGVPALYEFSQAFYPVGQSVDPSAGTLTAYYARAPIALATVASTIDPLFPEPYIDLLQNDLAAYLARKDQRDADEASFQGQKAALIVLLIEWARAQTYSLTQRFPIISPPLTNSDGGRQAPGTQG